MNTLKRITAFLVYYIVCISTVFSQTVYTVTKTTDPDPFVYRYHFDDSICAPELLGTLQWAIRKVNDTQGNCIINFGIPGNGPHVIYINNYLPQIINTVIIDGTTQAGYSFQNPAVIIDGQENVNVCDGIIIYNTNNFEIHGLYIRNFTNRSIALYYSDFSKIIGNIVNMENYQHLGTGRITVANSHDIDIYGNIIGAETTGGGLFNSTGIYLWEVDYCNIGGALLGQPNLITQCANGVTIGDSYHVKISRNLIFDNGLGLWLLENANNNKQSPEIISLTNSILSGTSQPGDSIEIFGSTGFQRANEYLTTVITDASGTWNATITNFNWSHYIATATDTSNNTSMFSNAFQFVMPCFANAGDDVAVCFGESAQLYASTGVSYIWFSVPYDSSLVGLESTQNPVAKPLATTSYTLIVTDANGCTATDDVVVSVNPLPFAEAGNDVTINAGDSVQIGSSPIAGFNYSWLPPGELSNPLIAKPYAKPTTTTTYNIKVEDTSNGCIKLDSVKVKVLPPPGASCETAIEITPGTICNPDTFTFTGTKMFFKFTADTSYIDIIVSDVDSADSGIDALFIGFKNCINPTPFAQASNPLRLTENVLTDSTYLVIVSKQSPNTTHFSICLSDFTGSPIIANAGNDVSICMGTNTPLNASGGSTYSWSPATGLSNTTISNPVASPSVTTTYTVTVTDSINGGSATDDVVITVNPLPIAYAGIDTTINAGSSVQIGSPPMPPVFQYSYLWGPPAGLSNPFISNPVATPMATTIYNLLVTNMQTGCTNSDFIKVNVIGMPPPPGASCETAIDITPHNICIPDTFTFSGTKMFFKFTANTSYINIMVSDVDISGSEINEMLFGFGTCINPTVIAQVFNPLQLTENNLIIGDTFLIRLKKQTPIPTNFSICLIDFAGSPIIADAGNDTSICAGSSTQLNATGGTTYSWSPATGLSNPTISNPVASPSVTTTYTVTVTDSINGGFATDNVVLTVNVLPVADAGSDATIVAGDSVQIGSSAISGYTYLWSPAIGLSSTIVANPWVKTLQNTTYHLTVTDINGCLNYDSVIVFIIDSNSIIDAPTLIICGADADFFKNLALNDSKQQLVITPADAFPPLLIEHCDKFDIYYEDINSSNNAGFADIMDGLDRKNTLCAVLMYVQSIFDFSSIPTGEHIRLYVDVSYDPVVNLAQSGTRYLAQGGAFYNDIHAPQLINGFVSDYVLGGSDPTTSNNYHGILKVNFDKVYEGGNGIPINWLNDYNQTIPNCYYDLYSVLLHEVGHVMGWFSLIVQNNNTFPTSSIGDRQFTKYDDGLHWGPNQYPLNLQKIIQLDYLGLPEINLSFAGISQALLNKDIWLSGNQPPDNHPVYSGVLCTTSPDWENTLSLGSLISHLDEQMYTYSYRSRISPGDNVHYVMSPFSIKGVMRRNFTVPEQNKFIDLGYTYKYSSTAILNNNLPPFSEKMAEYNSFTYNLFSEVVLADYTLTNINTLTNNNLASIQIDLSIDNKLTDYNNDQISVFENSLTNIRGCGNIGLNDFGIISGNNHNQLKLSNNNQTITYKPRPGFYGRAQFGFKLWDEKELGSYVIYTIDVLKDPNVICDPTNFVINGDFEAGTEVKRLGNEEIIDASVFGLLEEGKLCFGKHFSDAHPYNHISNFQLPYGGGDRIKDSWGLCNQGSILKSTFGQVSSSYPVPYNPDASVGQRYMNINENYNYFNLCSEMIPYQKYTLKFDYYISQTQGTWIPLTIGFTNAATFPGSPSLTYSFVEYIDAGTYVTGWRQASFTFYYCSSNQSSNILNLQVPFPLSSYCMYFFIDNLELKEDESITPAISVDIITYVPTIICEGNNIALQANVTNPVCNTTYNWQPGGYTVPWILVSPTTTTTYTVTVTDYFGNIATDEIVVTVIPNPTAFTLTGGGSYCTGGTSLSVTLSGSQTGVNYQLKKNGINQGSIVSGTGSPLVWTNQTAGSYTVVSTYVASPNCSATMNGSVVIIESPNPNIFNLTGGDSYCAGGSGLSVSLSGSQSGINYQLIKNGINQGAAISGTGNSLLWNNLTFGTYTVLATYVASPYCTANMNGSVVITESQNPTVFNITGGGSYCTGGSLLSITLSGSQSSVNYQLKKNGLDEGAAVSGTGSSIVWNNLTAGTYTVVATYVALPNCTADMNGSVTITESPNPTAYTLTGGGNYCAGGSGLSITLNGSQLGVNYQLMKNGIDEGTAESGTGSSIVWNNLYAGTYAVVATNIASPFCSANMTGSVVITESLNPTVFTLTGGGSYCTGGALLSVTLSSSQTGVNYQLKKNGIDEGTALSGTGSSIVWNNLTAGTYTVVATYVASPNCTADMNSSVLITEIDLPTATITINGIPFVCQNDPAPNIIFTNPQSFPVTVTYNINGGSNQTINVDANNFATVTVLTASVGNFAYNLVSVAYQTSPACSNTITGTVTVTVEPYLLAGVVISTNPLPCVGASVTFTATPTNGGINPSYQWQVNGNNVGTNNSIYTYTLATNDVIMCIMTPDYICGTGNPAISNVIYVISPPASGFNVTGLCQNDVTFESSPYESYNIYSWDVNNDGDYEGTTSSQIFPYIYSAPGYYLVTQAVSNVCFTTPVLSSQLIQVIPFASGYNNVDNECCSEKQKYDQKEPYTVPALYWGYTWEYGSTKNPWSVLSGSVLIKKDLIIPTGCDLTIKDMTFEFGPNGRVIVERGAKLTLDGCVFKGLDICHTMWQGVEVWGNSTAYHFNFDGTPNTAGQDQQGRLYMINDAKIMEAHNAVLLGRTDVCICPYSPPNQPQPLPVCNCKKNPYLLNYDGGILEADHAIFMHNAVAVKILPFHPNAGTHPGALNNNACKIINSNISGGFLHDPGYLKNNPDYEYPLTGTYCPQYANANSNKRAVTGIYQWNVRYVTIDNDEFQTSLIEGIKSFDSPYNVSSSLFQYLDYGIRIFNTSSSLYGHKIFDNLYPSDGFYNIIENDIQIEGSKYVNIKLNTFGKPSEPPLPNNTAILLNNSSNFKINDNDFYKINKGINCINSSTGGGSIASLTRPEGNIFTDCPLDIETSGNNPKLQIHCNSSNNYNFNTSISNWENYGIFTNQGQLDNTHEARKPAGNAFWPEQTSPIDQKLINNNYYLSQQMHKSAYYKYYSHGVINNPNPERVPSSSSIGYNINSASSPYNPSASCFPCISLSCDKTALNEDIIKINALQNEYIIVFNNLDKGITQQLLTAINSSMPTGNLKNKLLDASPLSDTVLITTINRPNPLPPGILKDIILPNSPVSDRVRYEIDIKINSLPPGIAKQIIDAQADNQAYRTITAISSELNEVKNDYQLHLNNYIQYLFNNDSLTEAVNILENQDDNETRQMLISTYLADSNFTTAQNKLNSFVPESQEELDWKDLNTLLLNYALTGKTVFEMSASEEIFISGLANDNTCSLASINAQAILRLVYGEEFPLCAVDANNLRINGAEASFVPDTSVYLGNNIPNPFNNTTLIPYRLPDSTGNAYICIFDITGKKLFEVPLISKAGTVSISLENYRAGVYLYSLMINDFAIQTKRMVLIK